MFHFLTRAIGYVLLAAALVFAILDTTRSITASELVITPLARTIDAWAPGSLADWRVGVEASLHPLVWDPVIVFALRLPTWLVAWFLSMLALWLGQRSPDRLGRFASR